MCHDQVPVCIIGKLIWLIIGSGMPWHDLHTILSGNRYPYNTDIFLVQGVNKPEGIILKASVIIPF